MSKERFYVWYGQSYKNLPKMGLGQELVLALMSTSDDDKISDLLKRMNAGSVNEAENGFTPLIAACWKNNAQVAAKLLSIPGVDVNARSVRGCTPIQMASMHETAEVFELLLEDSRVELDIKDEDGLGLEEAICVGVMDLPEKCKRLKMIEDARRKSENSGAQVTVREMTSEDRDKYVEKVNKVNSEIEEKKRRNNSQGYGEKLVQELMHRYEDHNGAKNDDDEMDEYDEYISELLEDIDTLNVNEIDKDEGYIGSESIGYTCLHASCEVNHVKAVAKLLTIAGIDVNAKNNSGQTPVMLAKCDALKLMLLDTRVDLDVRDDDGKSLEEIFESEYSEDSEDRLQMVKEAKGKRKHTEDENDVNELTANFKEKINEVYLEIQAKRRKIRDEENEEHCKDMGLVEKLIFRLEYREIPEQDKVNELLDQMNAETLNEAGHLSALLKVACGNRNNAGIVDKLLSIPGIDVNIPAKLPDGRRPLHVACGANDDNAVAKFLAFPGINVNAVIQTEGSYYGGFTPVMFAKRCTMKALKLMLDDPRVDLNVKNKAGVGLEDPEFAHGGSSLNIECLKMIKEEMRKRELSQAKPKEKKKIAEFGKLLEGVTFTISGMENPLRGEIRGKALEMGAKYKGDWDSECTHLVCAFANTPKYNQVKGEGKIVNKHWIEESYRRRVRLPWRRFYLDEADRGEESEEEIWDETLLKNEEPSADNTDELDCPDPQL